MSFVVVFFCVYIIAKLIPLLRFAFVKQHASQEQLKNEAVVLVL